MSAISRRTLIGTASAVAVTGAAAAAIPLAKGDRLDAELLTLGRQFDRLHLRCIIAKDEYRERALLREATFKAEYPDLPRYAPEWDVVHSRVGAEAAGRRWEVIEEQMNGVAASIAAIQAVTIQGLAVKARVCTSASADRIDADEGRTEPERLVVASLIRDVLTLAEGGANV